METGRPGSRFRFDARRPDRRGSGCRSLQPRMLLCEACCVEERKREGHKVQKLREERERRAETRRSHGRAIDASPLRASRPGRASLLLLYIIQLSESFISASTPLDLTCRPDTILPQHSILLYIRAIPTCTTTCQDADHGLQRRLTRRNTEKVVRHNCMWPWSGHLGLGRGERF
jgi:hypothetical protein